MPEDGIESVLGPMGLSGDDPEVLSTEMRILRAENKAQAAEIAELNEIIEDLRRAREEDSRWH